MTGATADGEQIDTVELLHRSDLSAVDRRRVRDALVSCIIEGQTLERKSVPRLIAFAAGRITIDEYKDQILATMRPAAEPRDFV
jgi:hypothetical protein